MTALSEQPTELNLPMGPEGLLLGDAVVLLRCSMGLTQKGLGKRAGLGAATIGDVEMGKAPSPHTLERLAEALDVPSDELAVLTPGRWLPKLSASNSNGDPIETLAGEPGSWTWHSLDYDDDPWARELCDALKADGRTLSTREIAPYFGRSKSWVDVEFQRAMGKLRRSPDFADIEDWLR